MRTVEKKHHLHQLRLTDEGDIWWEGMDESCEHAIDWKGREWTPTSPEPPPTPTPASPRRRAMPGHQPRLGGPGGCPHRHLHLRRPALDHGAPRAPGVRFRARRFHGRVRGVRDHRGGTGRGAETAPGPLRHDAFHRIPRGRLHPTLVRHGETAGDKAPAIFYVNWFRKNREGRWLWPGFGENSRVMKWMCERLEGKVGAEETPIGYMPKKGDLI